jgi:hypothetical protein
VLVAGGYFGYKTATAPAVLDTYVEINATPYATVTSVVSKDGKHTYPVNTETPVRVNLPSGDWIINGTDAAGQPVKQEITISKTSPGVGITLGAGGAPNASDIVKSSN